MNVDAPNFEKQMYHKKDYKPMTKTIDLSKSPYPDNFLERSNKSKLKWIMKKLDDSFFPNSDSHKQFFEKFDKNKDGFVCEKDFIENMTSIGMFNKQDSKI